MKKMMVLVLAVICVVSLFGFAAAEHENETQTPCTEQGNIPDNKECTSAGTTINSDTTEQETKDLSSEIPGAVVHVVAIWDRTQTEQIACGSALEKFWEDETNEYYFECIKSQYIMVMDSTSRTVDVVTALEEGLITIETLDKYGVKYGTEPKKQTK